MAVEQPNALPKRWDALALVVDEYPTEPIVVTLGGTTRELAAMHRSPNHLYVLDSMGLPPAIGLGLALGLQDSSFEKVVVLEGDGSLLMGFSTLATIGFTRPEKLVLVILDNGTYQATGNQPTASAAIDFCAVAGGCRIETREVRDLDAFGEALRWSRRTPGPLLIRAHVSPEPKPTPFVLEDPVLLGQTFASYLAGRK